MTCTVMPKPKDPPSKYSAEPAAKNRKTESAFDIWLHRGLHDIYDQVSREPIPDELLRLIEEDRKK